MSAHCTVERCPSGDCVPGDTARPSSSRLAAQVNSSSSVHSSSAHSSSAAVPTDRERLLPEHIESIYRLIYASVGNREEAEDLTTRVFMTASQHIGRCAAEEMYDLLIREARATIDDYWRAFAREPLADSDLPPGQYRNTPQPDVIPPLTAAQQVERILTLLPSREREVLTHRFLLNRSARETAEILLLTEADVMALVYQALKMAADLVPGTQRVP